MAAALFLLTHAGRMHAACLPEHSPCIIVPNNKTRLIFPAEMPSHYY